MGSSKSITANIKTNLGKRRKQKISQISDNFAITDFIIKNRKLLSKVKICRVKLIKIPKNKLLKRKIPNVQKKNGNEKRVRVIKDAESASKANIKKNSRPKRVELARNAKEVSDKNKKIQNAKNSPAPNPEPVKTSPTESKVISLSKKNSDGKSKRQIYIRLPLLDNVNKLQKVTQLSKVRKGDFKNKPVKTLSKIHLTQKFGKRFFQCHVEVMKLNDPNNPTPEKFKNNRKNVSFVETVEILGDGSSNSDTDGEMIGNNVDSLNKEPLNDNIESSSSHKSTLRKSVEEDESPKRKFLRKSDEKIPPLELRKKMIEEDLADNDVNIIENLSTAVEIVSTTGDTDCLEEPMPNTEECILPDNPPLLFVDDNKECATEVIKSHVNNIAQSVTLESEEEDENIQDDAANDPSDTNSNVKKSNYEEMDSFKSCSSINQSKDTTSIIGLSSAAKPDEIEDLTNEHDEYNDDDIYMTSDTNEEMKVINNKKLQAISNEKLSDELTVQPDDSSEEVMEDVADMSQSSLQTKFSLTNRK